MVFGHNFMESSYFTANSIFGTVLLLLGFRTLRRENRWLGGCFAVTVIRAVYFFATLVLNTTILQTLRGKKFIM